MASKKKNTENTGNYEKNIFNFKNLTLILSNKAIELILKFLTIIIIVLVIYRIKPELIGNLLKLCK